MIATVLLTGGLIAGLTFRHGAFSKSVVLGALEAVISGVVHLVASHLDNRIDWGAGTNGWLVLVFLLLPIFAIANLLGCLVGTVSLKLRKRLIFLGTNDPSE